MKALTVCQPYASMMFKALHGLPLKNIENRPRNMNYRGRLLIHAGKSRDWYISPSDALLPHGVIIGAVTVVDCVSPEEAIYRFPGNRHVNGPWCIVIENPKALNFPIPCKGALGLWDFDLKTAYWNEVMGR